MTDFYMISTDPAMTEMYLSTGTALPTYVHRTPNDMFNALSNMAEDGTVIHAILVVKNPLTVEDAARDNAALVTFLPEQVMKLPPNLFKKTTDLGWQIMCLRGITHNLRAKILQSTAAQ